MLRTRVPIHSSKAQTYKSNKLQQARPFRPRKELLRHLRPSMNYQQDLGPCAKMHVTVTMSLVTHFPAKLHMTTTYNTLSTPSPSSTWYRRQQNTDGLNSTEMLCALPHYIGWQTLIGGTTRTIPLIHSPHKLCPKLVTVGGLLYVLEPILTQCTSPNSWTLRKSAPCTARRTISKVISAQHYQSPCGRPCQQDHHSLDLMRHDHL